MLFLSLCVADLGLYLLSCFFFQAEDGIRDLVRSRGLGDVYKRQVPGLLSAVLPRRLRRRDVRLRRRAGAPRGLCRELSLIHI